MIKFVFKTLTPLHISNGEELNKDFHYLIDGDKFYRLDINKTARYLAENNLIDFKKLPDVRTLERIISAQSKAILKVATHYSLKIQNDFKEYLVNPRANGRFNVIEFINSNGNFYIPASAVKGAMCTALGLDGLGINNNNPDIRQRVVFNDSDSINSDKFSVYRTQDRPPANNMICLDKNIEFTLNMRHAGLFPESDFISKLNDYYNRQLTLAIENVEKYNKFRTKKSMRAELYLKSIEKVRSIKLEKGEALFNVGFGGGSWFKIEKGKVPKFHSKARNSREMEVAHTSYSFIIEKNELTHIGWCKVRMEKS